MFIAGLLAASSAPAQRGGVDENQRFRLAEGYESSGDFRNAARVYLELYSRDPASNVYYEGLRRAYVALAAWGDLLAIVAERAERMPGDVGVRTHHADALMRNGRREEALSEWRAARELRPKDPMTYHLVAASQIDNRLLDAAADTYAAGRRALGDPIAFADQLAQLYTAMARFTDASEEYLTMLDADAERLYYVMAGLGMFTANPDGAGAAIAAVAWRMKARPDYLPYLELTSWLQTERGDYDAAFDIACRLDKVRGGQGSDVYAFADRALREGRYQAAMTAAEYFRATYPATNALSSSVALLYTKALAGRYRAEPSRTRSAAEELVESFVKIAEENRGPAAPEALHEAARLLAEDLDDPQAAIATLDRLREQYPRYPDLPEAWLLKGDLLLRLDDLTAASAAYAELGTMSARDADHHGDLARLRIAELQFFAGKFKEAAEAFAKLADDPTSDVANDALAYGFLLQDNTERNAQALTAFAAGSLRMRQRRWAQALEQMDRAAGPARGSSLAGEVALARARAQEMLGAPQDAVATLLAIVKEEPEGAASDRALFRAAELSEQRLNNTAQATELYTRLLAEYPASSNLAAARARIRAIRGE